jgi:hypothetical protein
MTNLRAENHALRAELSAQQQQLADASMAQRSAGGPHSRHGAASSFLSNKKNEDDAFDVEAAVLTGAIKARSYRIFCFHVLHGQAPDQFAGHVLHGQSHIR